MYTFIFLSSFVCGAVNAATTQALALSPWVQNTTSIKVHTLKDTLTIPITANTTVGNVKNWIQEDVGVPVDLQNIYLIKSYYWGILKDTILLSDNTVNIKSAMHLYNANTFSISFKLPRS